MTTQQKTYTWNFDNMILKTIPNAKYYKSVMMDTKYSSGKDKYVTIFSDADNEPISYHLAMKGISQNDKPYFRCVEEPIKSLNYFKNKDREILEETIKKTDIEAQY
jgi:hypothetical protein